MKDQIAMEKELRVPGGILIMAKPHIDIRIIKKVQDQVNDYYGLAVTCMLDNTIMVAVYFSPKCPLGYMKACINKALNGYEGFPRMIIGGDFNQKDDVQFLIDIGFKNFVTVPTTRWMTRIDHLYANFDKEILTWVNPSYFSDHHSVIAVLGVVNAVPMENVALSLDAGMDVNDDTVIFGKIMPSYDECMDVDVTIDESLNIESPTDNSSDKRRIQKAVHFHRLKNSWNTCWLNSIFQALWVILATDCTFSLSPNTDMSSIIFNWIYNKSKDIPQIFDLYNEKISDLSLKKTFLMCIGKFNELQMKSQEDAVEAFQEFINQCDSLTPLRHSQMEIYHCPTCGSEQTTCLQETILSVPIQSKFNERGKFNFGSAVLSLFNQYENSEKVCSDPSCRFQCQKKSMIVGKPKYLMINLNRAGPNNKKIQSACTISCNLTINTTEGPTHFELISVVKHIGPSSNSGHYICYRKSEEGWFEMHDNLISFITISTMETANLFIY